MSEVKGVLKRHQFSKHLKAIVDSFNTDTGHRQNAVQLAAWGRKCALSECAVSRLAPSEQHASEIRHNASRYLARCFQLRHVTDPRDRVKVSLWHEPV